MAPAILSRIGLSYAEWQKQSHTKYESSEQTTDLYSGLRPFLTDDLLQRLESNLAPSGRGRPLKLPPAGTTNRVFLQLGLLRVVHNKTCEDLNAFASYVFSLYFGDILPLLSSIIHRIEKDVKATSPDHLNDFLNTVQDFTYVNGVYCHKFGITRDMLLDFTLFESTESLPNGLVVDLEHIRKQHNYKDTCFQYWLTKLCPALSALCTSNQLRKKVDALMKQHQKLKKNGRDKLSSLLEQDFLDFIRGTARPKKQDLPLNQAHNPNILVPTSCCECLLKEQDTQKIQRENQRLSCKVRELMDEIENQKVQIDTLQKSCSSQQLDINHLKESLLQGNQALQASETEKVELEQKLAEKSKQCAAYAATPTI